MSTAVRNVGLEPLYLDPKYVSATVYLRELEAYRLHAARHFYLKTKASE